MYGIVQLGAQAYVLAAKFKYHLIALLSIFITVINFSK